MFLRLLLAGVVLMMFSCAAPDWDRQTEVEHPAVVWEKSEPPVTTDRHSEHGGVTVNCGMDVACEIIEVDGTARLGSATAILSPGRHALTVGAGGYKEASVRVHVDEGDAIAVRVKLEPLPATVTFDSFPAGATVVMEGGSLKGLTPLPDVSVPPGNYILWFKKSGYDEEVVQRRFGAGEHANVTIKLKKETGYVRFKSQEPWMKLAINGVEIERPEIAIELTTGSHIVFAATGCKVSEMVFEVKPRSESVVHIVWSSHATLKEKYVCLPGGTFPLGADVYKPMNPVRSEVIETFWMSRYEVTVGEYQECVTDGGCTIIQWGGDCNEQPERGLKLEHPVTCISPKDAERYTAWLSARTDGVMFRLPTESEWERTVRGSWTGRYPKAFGTYKAECNTCGKECETFSGRSEHSDSWSKSAPVGAVDLCQTKEGVFDLIGNVAEWVVVSKGKDGAKYGFRGGSWYQQDAFLDPAYPTRSEPDYRTSYIGFRLVADPHL